MSPELKAAIENLRSHPGVTVRTHLRENEIEKERQRGKRLTQLEREQMLKRILVMKAEGMTRKKIAKILGVAQQTVTNIASNAGRSERRAKMRGK